MKNEWKTITKDELKQLYYEEGLSDKDIAARFEVSSETVRRKREKFALSYATKIYKQFKKENAKQMVELNLRSKKRLLNEENIDMLSKAITHYIFRNGPVEDMHVDDKLSENDMCTLNKYMVNKLATLFSLAIDNDWLLIEEILAFHRLFGLSWDKAEPDMEDVDNILKSNLENYRKEYHKSRISGE